MMTHTHPAPSGADVGKALTTPKAAAVAGILFAVSMAAAMYLVEITIAEGDLNDGSWLLGNRDRVTAGVALIPLAGIFFLWFMGVIRHRFGDLEDQFYSTVFLGSGFLFVAMLFSGTAILGAILAADKQDPQFAGSGAYLLSARLGVAILGTYALKMAGVFLFSLGTMFLRTGVMPRWVGFAQFAVGAVLLIGFARYEGTGLLFPLWILVVSLVLLVLAFREPGAMASKSGSADADRARRSA
jgi:hypothetical protein